jgi:transcriptional regulator with XRE-family HTH domain
MDMSRNSNAGVFWENVERVMKSKGIQWKTLSDSLGKDASTISSMKAKQSRVSLDYAMAIADILGVTIDSLVRKNASSGTKFELDDYETGMIITYRNLRGKLGEDFARKLMSYSTEFARAFEERMAADSNKQETNPQ